MSLVIAVDAMGGDNAPHETVKGAMEASQQFGVQVLLVGDEAQIIPLINQGGDRSRIEVLHAPDTIAMGAHPLEAVRKQKSSSIVVGAAAVKDGQAQALVSAGSTGAAMAAALLSWGRIKGIARPAIGTVLPTLQGPCLLLDAGAQVDSRPEHLVQFAPMGSIYAEKVLGVEKPRVGLLNIGEEETKGSELVVHTYQRLCQESQINFIGNVEGRDIMSGNVDVVVCDGFVGNVVLKLAEGVGNTIFGLLSQAVTKDLRSKVGALLLKDALRGVKRRLDYTEYGGAPLLGVRGVCIIGHGSSNAKAIKNAIRVAKEAVDRKIVPAIAQAMADQSGKES